MVVAAAAVLDCGKMFDEKTPQVASDDQYRSISDGGPEEGLATDGQQLKYSPKFLPDLDEPAGMADLGPFSFSLKLFGLQTDPNAAWPEDAR